MNLINRQKHLQEIFETDYKEFRKTMKHSKAIHAIKDKHFYSYNHVTNIISPAIVAQCVTIPIIRPMKRMSKAIYTSQDVEILY